MLAAVASEGVFFLDGFVFLNIKTPFFGLGLRSLLGVLAVQWFKGLALRGSSWM